MPKVHTLKAAKDYPDIGVKKGETYYRWAFRYGGPRMSKTRPRPSQLTQSKLSGAYAAREALEDAINAAGCPQDLVDALNECAEQIREVASEYEEAFDAMGENLQQGDAGQQCEEKKDALETYADELESAASEIEGKDAGDYATEGEYKKGSEQNTFDELNSADQESMMDDCRSEAEGPSLDV